MWGIVVDDRLPGTPAEPAAAVTHDVFVSYRQTDPDLRWVADRLVPRLQQEDIRVFVDYLSFRVGVPVLAEIERAVLSCRYTLAVLTPAYLASAYGHVAAVLARHFGPEQRERRLIAVRLDLATELPPGFRAAHVLDAGPDRPFGELIVRLAAVLRQDPDA